MTEWKKDNVSPRMKAVDPRQYRYSRPTPDDRQQRRNVRYVGSLRKRQFLQLRRHYRQIAAIADEPVWQQIFPRQWQEGILECKLVIRTANDGHIVKEQRRESQLIGEIDSRRHPDF